MQETLAAATTDEDAPPRGGSLNQGLVGSSCSSNPGRGLLRGPAASRRADRLGSWGLACDSRIRVGRRGGVSRRCGTCHPRLVARQIELTANRPRNPEPRASRSWPVRRQHTGVDRAFDQTQVPHGPGAVRVLIYGLCDSRERLQLAVRNPLGRGCRDVVPRKSVTSL